MIFPLSIAFDIPQSSIGEVFGELFVSKKYVHSFFKYVSNLCLEVMMC